MLRKEALVIKVLVSLLISLDYLGFSGSLSALGYLSWPRYLDLLNCLGLLS